MFIVVSPMSTAVQGTGVYHVSYTNVNFYPLVVLDMSRVDYTYFFVCSTLVCTSPYTTITHLQIALVLKLALICYSWTRTKYHLSLKHSLLYIC